MLAGRLALLLIAFPSAALAAQGLVDVMTRADAADSAGRHAEAMALYRQAYGMSGFDPGALIAAAQSGVAARRDADAFRDLNRAVDQGFLQPGLLGDSGFSPLHRDPRWNALAAKVARATGFLNQPLRTELLALVVRDQKNRDGLNDIMQRFGVRSPQGDSALKALTAADAPIQQRMREIVTQYGWPTRALVADDGAHAAWLIVQHMPAEYQQEMLPRVLAAVKNGQARAGDGALLQDRVLVHAGQPQLYGSQMSYAPTGGAPTLDSLADPACVDVRRRSVGLEPLVAYLKAFGVSWTPTRKCASRK